jgi:hypothetical protein
MMDDLVVASAWDEVRHSSLELSSLSNAPLAPAGDVTTRGARFDTR